MQAFEYANPKTLKEAFASLGSEWGEADVLAGGTDLLSLMKEYLHTPKRVVNIKGIKELGGISKTAAGLRIGSTVTFDESGVERSGARRVSGVVAGRARRVEPADPQHGNSGRRPVPAPALLVLPHGLRPARHGKRAEPG